MRALFYTSPCLLNQYFQSTSGELESGHQFCALPMLLCLSHSILLELDVPQVPVCTSRSTLSKALALPLQFSWAVCGPQVLKFRLLSLRHVKGFWSPYEERLAAFNITVPSLAPLKSDSERVLNCLALEFRVWHLAGAMQRLYTYFSCKWNRGASGFWDAWRFLFWLQLYSLFPFRCTGVAGQFGISHLPQPHHWVLFLCMIWPKPAAKFPRGFPAGWEQSSCLCPGLGQDGASQDRQNMRNGISGSGFSCRTQLYFAVSFLSLFFFLFSLETVTILPRTP